MSRNQQQITKLVEPELSNLRGQVRAIKREMKRLSSDPNTDHYIILEKHNAFKSITRVKTLQSSLLDKAILFAHALCMLATCFANVGSMLTTS